MPALSAHWDLSKRQASLMAIFHVVLCNRGTRLRGWPDHRFVLLILTALSRRAAQIRGEPSKDLIEMRYAGSYAKVCGKAGLYGHTKNEAELS